MPKKPADPNKPKSVRRPKAVPAPAPAPVEEEVMVAEMDDQLRDICKTIPVDVQEMIVRLLAAKKNTTACRKFQDAATESGAPEIERSRQRACCIYIAQAFVQPEGAPPLAPLDSDGEDDSYEPKPAPVVPRLTGKRVLSKKNIDRECPINDIEFAEMAMALAKCEQDHREMALNHKAVRARLKQEVDDSNANRARLADVVTRRVEVRSVLVIVEVDYDMGVVREIDATTEDVLDTRPIAPSEMQVPLIPAEMLTEVQEPADTPSESSSEGGRTLTLLAGGKEDEPEDAPRDEVDGDTDAQDGNDEDVD